MEVKRSIRECEKLEFGIASSKSPELLLLAGCSAAVVAKDVRLGEQGLGAICKAKDVGRLKRHAVFAQVDHQGILRMVTASEEVIALIDYDWEGVKGFFREVVGLDDNTERAGSALSDVCGF